MNDIQSPEIRNQVPDLAEMLSEWSCDWATCSADSKCPACRKRDQAAELLRHHDMGMRPCTMHCTSATPCERCTEVVRFMRYLFLERNTLQPFLIALRRFAKAYPEELREILVEPVTDILLAAGEVSQ